MTRRRGEGGFTLIEVLVACSVLAGMMALTWATASQTVKARKHFAAVDTRYREARVAMARIARDLSVAYLSANEDRSLLDARTYFHGESSGDVDTVTFSTLNHMRLYADTHESDQTVVSYYEGTDPDDKRLTSLFRRELRRPGNEQFASLPGEADVIFSDIEKLKLTYWDVQNQEWEDTWCTLSADGKANKLPDRVRIALTFKGEDGRDITLTTESRVYMQEVLQAYAN
jgi:general secretion pathway protein J